MAAPFFAIFGNFAGRPTLRRLQTPEMTAKNEHRTAYATHTHTHTSSILWDGIITKMNKKNTYAQKVRLINDRGHSI